MYYNVEVGPIVCSALLALCAGVSAPRIAAAQGLPPAGVQVGINVVDKDSGLFVPAFLMIRMEYPSSEKVEEFSIRIYRASQEVNLVMPPADKGALARLVVSAPGYSCEDQLVVTSKQFWESAGKAGSAKKRPLLAKKTFRMKKARR
jgi:hypothetical protein